MPLDHRPRVAATKPLTPALSANIRVRSAIAPKLAGSTPTSPATGLQRTWKAQTASPERTEEDRPQSLSSNITPRSGARTTRLGTESPTTNTTPKDEFKPSATISGLGISSPADRPSSTASSKLTNQLITPSKRRTSGSSNVSQANNDAKFFHANDVRTPPPTSRPAALRSRPTSFVRAASPRSSPKKTAEPSEKFFRADDGPSQPPTKLVRPLLRTKNSSSSVNTTPRFKPESIYAPTSPLVKDVVVPRSKPRALSNAGSAVAHTDRRRSSSLNTTPIQNSKRTEHRKSLSTSTITAASAELREPPPPPSVVTSSHTAPAYTEPPPADTILAIANSLKQLTGPLSPDSTSPRSTSLTSANTTGTSGTANTELSTLDPKPTSVSKHVRGISETQVNIAPISQAQLEAAANARRERKVLDLEISNSSLLAINKTLEKELKKQNAELRRFKRLSRSGRLSLVPTARAVSAASTLTLGAVTEDEQEHSYLSFSEDDSEGEKSEDEEDDSYLSDENSSAGHSSGRARRRARDEKRILQDLTRHREMLIESQKLTQSIHRCINCTDELIKDGTRALAYRVGIGDVKLGGRVLSQDDDDENDDSSGDTDSNSHGPVSRQGLLSPVMPKSNVNDASIWIANLQGLDQQGPHHAPFGDAFETDGLPPSVMYSP